ncbi:MAG: hypothetical protein IKK58_02315 [Clostridia bacterium]|nr:hypothetical protein [Clostridia bacterium]
MKIKDRLNELEMAVYCLSRPLFIKNSQSITLQGEQELFRIKAGGAVRWGMLHVKPIAAAPCALRVKIYDPRGLCSSSGQFWLIAGENAVSYPIYYKGSGELSVRVECEGASIAAEGAVAVISGGRA